MDRDYKNSNFSDFDSIFGTTSKKYEIKNINSDGLRSYTEAYKIFKEDNPDSKSILSLNIGNNTLELLNFDGIDMFKFGKITGRLEAEYESASN